MSIFTAAVIKEKSRLEFVTVDQWKNNVQSLLEHASYHALKGNSDPLNYILEDAKSAKVVHLTALTRWVEFNLPVIVREEKFKMAKGWVKSEVKDEAMFEEINLPKLQAAPKWFETGKKEKAASVWDIDTYLASVVKTLEKNGKGDVAKEIKALKGKMAQAAIEV